LGRVTPMEGVVVKHREHGYRPRRRSWWKVRTRVTADAVVGGVIGALDAPDALLLGLPDERGRLRVAGRTAPLTLPARRELGALLMPPRRAHPWPDRIPSSRFGQLPGDLIDYTPTEPMLVVELDADVCFEHDRWRHPTRFRRIRGDLQPMDLTTQLPRDRASLGLSI
jgi:ATP-dependent DNA ligase